MHECNCVCHREKDHAIIGKLFSLLCDCDYRRGDPVICYEMRHKKNEQEKI